MKSIIAGIAGILFATTAGATGPGPVAPEPLVLVPAQVYAAPTNDIWNGGYVGLRLGRPLGQNFHAQLDLPTDPTFADDWRGQTWGASAGYDLQRGTTVYGAALDYNRGAFVANPIFNPAGIVDCGAGCQTTVADRISLRARAGVVRNRTLFYATGGVSSAEVSAQNIAPATTRRMTGWLFGVGVEHAITDSLTLGVEYSHTDLGRLQIPVPCFQDCYTDAAFGTLQVTANLRF